MDKIEIKRQGDAVKIIKKLANGKKNIIFGAGSIGGLIKDALEKLGITIELFLVNDMHRRQSSYKNIKVIELSEYTLKHDECNIVYSIQSNDLDIMDNMTETMKNNILFIDGMTAVFNLLKIFYTQYFKEHDISIDNDIINLNNIKVVNPFQLEQEYLNAFLFEAGDLILPETMNDYNNLNEGPYEHGRVKLEKGDVVFDCGANIGLFSSIAASKGCRCYAFEPVPETVSYLERTKLLYPDKIEISDYALSNEDGFSKLYITKDTNISNSMLALNQTKDNYIEIRTITIDNYVKVNNIEKVDFIKADIEGAERYMIMGARETLAKFAPKLSICTYHLEDDPEILEKLIKESNPNYIVEHKWKKLYAYVL